MEAFQVKYNGRAVRGYVDGGTIYVCLQDVEEIIGFSYFVLRRRLSKAELFVSPIDGRKMTVTKKHYLVRILKELYGEMTWDGRYSDQKKVMETFIPWFHRGFFYELSPLNMGDDISGEREQPPAVEPEVIDGSQAGSDLAPKALIPFNYNGTSIRVIKDEKGEPWFVARDVCGVLGYSKPQNAVEQHCKYAKIFKGPEMGQLTSSPRGLLIIPESDLYRLTMRSQLPGAVDFQDWVVETVLPAIRKTGGYVMGEEKMNEDELVLAAMQVLQRKVEVLRLQVEQQQPKVEAYDHLMDSNGLFNFRNASHILGIPERRFIAWLRASKYLTSAGKVKRGKDGIERKHYYNIASADYLKQGIFAEKSSANEKNRWTGSQTFITPKGLDYFRKRISPIELNEVV